MIVSLQCCKPDAREIERGIVAVPVRFGEENYHFTVEDIPRMTDYDSKIAVRFCRAFQEMGTGLELLLRTF